MCWLEEEKEEEEKEEERRREERKDVKNSLRGKNINVRR